MERSSGSARTATITETTSSSFHSYGGPDVVRPGRWSMERPLVLVFRDPIEGQDKGAFTIRCDETLAALSPTEEDRLAFEEIGTMERAYDRVLKKLGAESTPPLHKLEGILGKERRMRGGGWIDQAIHGINDGLGAAFGVVSGVAGATHVSSAFVLLSDFASMVASALSMGSGAYLADKSQKKVHEAEMDRERMEIENNPEEEQQELSLFYQQPSGNNEV